MQLYPPITKVSLVASNLVFKDNHLHKNHHRQGQKSVYIHLVCDIFRGQLQQIKIKQSYPQASYQLIME